MKIHPSITEDRVITEGEPSDAKVERIVSGVLRAHIGPEYNSPIGEGGCPRISWYNLRNELVAALLAAKSKMFI